MSNASFGDLLGRTLAAITGQVGDDSMIFTTTDGRQYRLFHARDCCEDVAIEDINGDLGDLVGSPIVVAEESASGDNPPGIKVPEFQDSFTWTFYKLATAKGYVTIRWYGSSNGYYSESVDFEEIEKPKGDAK